MTTDRATAIRRLTNRYWEQVEQFPRTREIPMQLYIQRNVRYVMQNDSLKDYGSRS